MQRGTSVRYEWDLLELDHGDIVEHHVCDSLAEVLQRQSRFGETAIELVRDAGNEADGITDRQWAQYSDGRLPERFDGGAKVPQRFHKECQRHGGFG